MGAEKHANDDKIQSEGREDNAAQHLNAAEPNAGAERYPPAGKDDAVESVAGERRAFEGAGDGAPDPSLDQSQAKGGSDASPAEEGKR
jgi:hypothetical protein